MILFIISHDFGHNLSEEQSKDSQGEDGAGTLVEEGESQEQLGGKDSIYQGFASKNLPSSSRYGKFVWTRSI